MNGSHLTTLARRLHDLAEQTRREAERMRASDGVTWRSTAADRYRERLADEALTVRSAAAALERAAEAMTHHARAVGALPGVPGIPHV
jgi:hypothetical protein